jgi:hypothetical protein
VTVNAVQSHLYDHYRSQVAAEQSKLRWQCPHCDATGREADRQHGVEASKRHLFDHVASLVEPGVHVADDIGRTGSVLVLTPAAADGADEARIHLHAPCDILVFVTTQPAARLRLLGEHLTSWPTHTVIVTTKPEPLAGLDGIDTRSIPLELVRLGGTLGLQDLRTSISAVVEHQERLAGKISVGFDILPEVLRTFELETVFRFLHVLTRRLAEADALSQFHVDPTAESESTLTVLEELLDLSIDATGNAFTTL